MFLTEEEAKTKICHKTFLMPEAPQCCIGSDCMAWRETTATTGAPIETTGNEKAPERRPGHRWRFGAEKGKSIWGLFKTLGYCGAAGPVDERTGH